ncbi:DUF7507 domain-containing protein [Flavobacterium sp. GNP001]
MKQHYLLSSLNWLKLDETLKINILKLLILSLFFSGANVAHSQCNSEIPRPFTTLDFDNLSVSSSTSGLCLLGCGISDRNNLIDADLTNSATASFGALGVGTTHRLRVSDGNTVYSAGSFAGFKIQPSVGVLNLDVLNGISINTYLSGTLVQSFSGTSLLGLSVLGNPSDFIVGFNTSSAFDAIEIAINSGVSALSSTSIYHAVIREYCAGPALVCNVSTKPQLPNFPVAINQAATGLSGVSLGSIADAENAINSDSNDFASINLNVGVVAAGTFAIKNQVDIYPINTFAGFEIENSNLAVVGALDNVVVATYLNGVFREQSSGSNLIANAGLLNAGGRMPVGFVATQTFNEIRLTNNQTLALNLGTTRVYGSVLQNFCAGPNLVCNTPTAMTSPLYPVFVNSANTGFDGVLCVGCNATDTQFLIDSDPSNFATINNTVGVGVIGKLAVKNQITDYSSGSFAGFTIETPALANVDALNGITIKTYLNGVVQETKSGSGALVAVGSNLLTGSGKQTLGFVTTTAYDEVQINFENTVAVSFGTIRVYDAVVQQFCAPTVVCDATYFLSNPEFPVQVNSSRSGISGLVCVGCDVANASNVVTADINDFANITLVAGVASTGSIAVQDQLFTYPPGTFAGFVIDDLGTLAQVDLFQSLTISTYNNGIFVESKSAANLIDLAALGINVLGSVPGVYNVGFKTSQEFDEVRISVNGLASVINSINIYGAFVNTSESNDGPSGNFNCFPSSLLLTKDGTYNDFNADGIVNVGDRIDYVFEIKNTGTDTLTNVTLTDNNAVVSGSPIASMPAGATDTTSYSALYNITQQDIDAGVVYNLATVSARTFFGTIITATSTDPTLCLVCPPNPSCTTCTATALPQVNSIALVKTAVYNGNATAAQVGDTITYTFTITNTGNTTLSNAVVSDAKLGMNNVAVSPSTLAPNASGTLTQNYTITQADIDAGTVTNSAIGSATDPSNATVSDTSGTTTTNDTPTVTTVPKIASVVLVKTAVYNGNATAAQVGDTITYTFTITNTGNTTLSNAVVSDTKLGMTNVAVSPSTLAPNASGTLTQNYTITQADINAGSVTNSAVGSATDPSNATVSDTSGTTTTNDTATVTNLPKIASVALVKTAFYNGNATAAQVGDTITYTFTITNTGNTTLSNAVVTDTKLGMTNVAVSPSTLAPNASGTLTQNYTITQADINAGSVTNSAIGSATDPSNATVSDTSGTTTTNDTATVTNLPKTASVALVKTAVYNGNATAAQVGDTITYTFTITNTGNTTLSNAVVTDAKLGMNNVAVSPSTLAPNASGTLTQNYTITQADINAGSVTNSAVGSATDPSNATVSDTSGTTTTNETPTVTNLPKIASVALVKTAVYNGNATAAQVGDTITYTFTITNTGNTTLSNAVVSDAKLGMTNVTVSPSTLAPNASGTLTQNYTITQADINAGSVTNSAIGSATDPSNATVSDTSGTTTTNDTPTVTNLPKIASVALVKTAVYNGNATAAQVGDTITYTFTITNTGNTTLSNAVVSDAKLGMTNVAVSPSTLAPNASGTLTQNYTITQADINAGSVTNSALGSATDPSNATVSDTSGTTTTNETPTVTNLPKIASVALVKTAVYNGNATAAQVGDTITYTFTITNTGNTTLSNAVVTDAKLGMTNVAVSPSTLAPNASGTLTQNYTITQADINAGSVTNSAIGSATDPSNATVSDTSGTTTTNDTPTVTNLPKIASVALVKTAVYNGNATAAQVGDTITYTFTITNTGNTTLTNAVVTDAKLGMTNVAVSPSTLAPNASGTLTQNYTITQADINAGSVTNSAIGSATDPSNATVSDTSGTTIANDTATVTNLPKTASVALVKTAVYNGNATAAQVGDTITYTFTITNTGNTTLSNAVVTDTKLGMTNVAVSPSTLAPNASGTLTQNYTITQADINAGSVTNSAIGSATDPSNATVSDTSGTTTTNDTATVTNLPKTASVALVKTAVYNGNATAAQVGDTITYTFTITNTGNTTLSNAVVTDAKLGMNNVAVSPSTLAPNASGTLTQNYTITQADINAGSVTNSAVGSATDPSNATVSDTSGTTTTNETPTVTNLPKIASVALVKTAVYNGNATAAQVGDTITYTFTITNTGNTTLSNAVVTDAKLGMTNVAVSPSTLAPNASGTLTQNYTITQADINAGSVTNSAIGSATDPSNATVSDTSGTTTTNDTPTVTNLPKIASVALVKTAVYNGNATAAQVGDTITYTFTITNTGNTTLSNAVVSDAKLGMTNVAVSPSTLAPNASGTLTQNYTITQADINAGSVTNSALGSATDPSNATVSDTSGTTTTNNTPTVTTVPSAPSTSRIALVKTGVLNGQVAVGTTITYTFAITNLGTETLTNVILTDNLDGIRMQQTSLPFLNAGQTNNSITGIYTINQADIDAGKVVNTALVTARNPHNGVVQDTSGTALNNDTPTTTILNSVSSISLLKEGVYEDSNNDGIVNIGDRINYTFTVQNTGQTTLSNVMISDPNVTVVGPAIPTLPVNAINSTNFSASYLINQSDISAGVVYNLATVSATNPQGMPVTATSTDPTPCATCPVSPTCLTCTITELPINNCAVEVFNAVSPNTGDDFERILYIKGIECYPNNTVQVFDRWGVKVFDIAGYNNTNKAFRGMSEGRVTVQQTSGLPTGTYFYVIDYTNFTGEKIEKTGYLHLEND